MTVHKIVKYTIGSWETCELGLVSMFHEYVNKFSDTVNFQRQCDDVNTDFHSQYFKKLVIIGIWSETYNVESVYIFKKHVKK